jgi:transposase
MASRAAEPVAGITDRIEGRPYRTGRPPVPTIEVVETLRFFVREGVQWRELQAAAGRACGSTLRRRLDEWSGTALLRRVHVALVRMVRAGPEVAPWDVVVDSCSVRAKRGGELTGPNPTDRGKAGTKYHVVVATDGTPLGAVPSAANVHDTRLFPHLLHLASAVCAAVGRLYADAAYHSAENRGLCAREGIQAGDLRTPGEAEWALRARGHPAVRPRGRRAARLGARRGPLRGRARPRVVARQQAAGPAPRQAGPGDPGAPDSRVRLHHREPPQPVLKTVPKAAMLKAT